MAAVRNSDQLFVFVFAGRSDKPTVRGTFRPGGTTVCALIVPIGVHAVCWSGVPGSKPGRGRD